MAGDETLIPQGGQPEAPATNPQEASKEELLLGKFRDEKELAKAYQELEKKLGKSPSAEEFKASLNPTEEANAEKPTPDTEKPAPDSEAAEMLKVAGLDISDFSKEWQEAGKLSDESFAKLEAAGFPSWAVERYIRGAEAEQAAATVAEAKRNELLQTVGGKDSYTEMLTWASKNMDAKEIDAYNRIMTSNDEGAMRWAMEGLKTKFVAANGSEPKLVKSDGLKTSLTGFKSSAEVTAAMRDPRYHTDEAFRSEVYAKLRNSPGIMGN